MGLIFPSDRNAPAAPGERLSGAAFAAAIHGVVVLALALGLLDPSHRLAEVVRPLAVRVIEAAQPKPEAPKPPPPKPRQPAAQPLPVLAVESQTPAPAGFVVPVQPPAPVIAPPIAAAPAPVPAAAPIPAPEPVVEARFDADYLSNPKPAYPSASRRLGEAGTVLVRVHVDSEGLPLKVELKGSSGFERLDQSALDTVARWRFVPARRGRTPVAAWVVVPIVFSLS